MKNKTGEMSFLGHLEALRWHLIRSAVAVAIFGILAFIFMHYIMDIVMMPKRPDFITNRWFCELSSRVHFINVCINQKDFALINLQMSGQFMMSIKIAITTGFILGCPYLLYEIWSFLKPALKDNEKKHSGGIIISSSLLFLTGILFGYFILSPISINFFVGYTLDGVQSTAGGIVNNFQIQSYIDILTSIVLACGAAFELPLIIYFLSKTGVVQATTLKKYRKHAVIGVLVVAAIITPPDIFSQILVSIPLIVLYEVGIMLAIRIEKARNLVS